MSAASPSATETTTGTFITALVTNSAVFAVELVIFVLLKNKLSQIYTPRTYLPPPEKRAPTLPEGPWKWIPAIVITPSQDIIRKNGLDAYMFLRFIRLMIIIFGSFTCVTWLVLLPIDTIGMKGIEKDILSRLSWGNIPDDQTKRYVAHIVVVYLLTFWVIYLIRREYGHYAHMRQDYLISKYHSRLPQARTVLVTSIPHQICTEKELKIWASFVPGGIQNIWVYRDTKELNKAHEERLDACKRLEAAESTLLRDAIIAKQKLIKHTRRKYPTIAKGPVSTRPQSKRAPSSYYKYPVTSVSAPMPMTFFRFSGGLAPLDLERGTSRPSKFAREKALLDALVPPSKRPRHRNGPFGLWGHEVDTIEWCTEEISKLNKRIDSLRNDGKEGKPLGSAFIQCNFQLGAHVLAQCVSYHEPMMMSYKWLQVCPKDVIWDNIDDGAYETRFRYVTSWMASIGMIILGFFPVSFVGLLSNVSELCVKVKWLAWICKARTPIPGIIQGVLPPLILAILFLILPWILRGLAWYENIPLKSLLSISVYKRYYLFLVIHGFLVVTLTSGLTATASDIINSPTRTVSQLASHLPNASVFFLTWTVTQGLTGAGSALLQVFTLFMYYIKKSFFGHTPRQAYAVTFLMPSVDFGTVLPQLSLLATVGLAYSVLSPIINGLATLAFALFYFAWKFLLTWVFDQPEENETGGLYFPIAIRNLFVGLYVEHVCLAALFFLKSSAGRSFLAQGILMLVLMALTIGAQIFLQKAFDPLIQYLPVSLGTKKMQARVEKQRHKDVGTEKHKGVEEFDLFNRANIRSVARKRIIMAASEALKSIPAAIAEVSNNMEHKMGLENPGLQKPTVHASSSSKPFEKQQRPMISQSLSLDNAYDDDLSDGDDGDFDDHGFRHPSSYSTQPWIWIPKDELGLSKFLVEELRASGVDASDEGSLMDSEGNVEVTRSPPDEEWSGDHDT